MKADSRQNTQDILNKVRIIDFVFAKGDETVMSGALGLLLETGGAGNVALRAHSQVHQTANVRIVVVGVIVEVGGNNFTRCSLFNHLWGQESKLDAFDALHHF
jgi:hypothetical protein